MPIDYKLYPPNWHALSREIRFQRARNICEWCGVPNYTRHPDTGAWVVLTVAHLGIDKVDAVTGAVTPGDKTDLYDLRPENLAALCQRCHLNYDRAEHWQARWRNARAARLARGEQWLPCFFEIGAPVPRMGEADGQSTVVNQ